MVTQTEWRDYKRTCWALVAIAVISLTLQKACAQTRSTIEVKTRSFAILQADQPTVWRAMKPLDQDMASFNTKEVPKLLYWTGQKLSWREFPKDKWILLVPTPAKPTQIVIDEMSGTVGTESWVEVRHFINVTADGDDDNKPDDPDEDDEDQDPDDGDDANPVPAPPGLRILVVYETEEENRALADVTASRKVRDWMNDNCVKVGQQPEFRFFDQHAEFPPGVDSVFARWMQRPRDSLPWLIVANGKKSFEGPFPHSAEALLSLLEQYK